MKSARFPTTSRRKAGSTAWARLVSLQQYQVLFAVIGFTYGGDKRTTFGLPDLRGRAAVGQGQGPGLSSYAIGRLQGADSVALVSPTQLPAHTHTITSKFMPPGAAPGASGSAPGGNAYLSRLLDPTTSPPTTNNAYAPNSTTPIVQLQSTALTPFPSTAAAAQAHENRQPFTTFRYCICATDGVYPPRP